MEADRAMYQDVALREKCRTSRCLSPANSSSIGAAHSGSIDTTEGEAGGLGDVKHNGGTKLNSIWKHWMGEGDIYDGNISPRTGQIPQ